MRPRRRLRLAFRRAIPIVTIPVLLAGTMAAASARARSATPGHRAVAGHPAAPHATAKRPLTATQALARARATGHPVAVSALTSPTSMTTARPDGSFMVTESARPVRAWRHGAWASLNPALHRDSNGMLSPAVTTSGLTLSGGGSGPFAVMTTDARTLSLSWPATLPTPTISGATATYANVLPGVDLAVTANAQGGLSSVLVVKDATAAANPALASLEINTTAPGLSVMADSGGNLRVAPSSSATPVFTAPTPLVWDSSPPPAGMPTATGPDGTLVNAQSGLPANSSLAAPGAGAHTAAVGVAVSGGTMTLSPPASALTGPGIVYPVYIDPTWWPAGGGASAWAQVDSGNPNTAYWKQSSDLQVGLCDFAGCNGIGTTRSFVRLPIPSQLTTDSVIHSANLYTTEVWAPSCTATSVRLYTVGVISSSTTWNNQPNWATGYSYQDAAFGYSSSCNAYPHDVTWDVTSTISGDIGQRTTQTWGLRAASETNDLEWKQFLSGSSNVTLSVLFNDPPYSPQSRATSPGGACQHSASTAPVIGDDDVIFSGYVTDPDGDNSLTTRFIILNSDGSTAYDSSAKGTSVKTAHNQTAALTLTRAVMQSLHSTAYTYHWYAITTDDNGLTSPNPVYDCYFTYDPSGPSAPSVSVPSTGVLGQSVTATFSTTGCSSSRPCPATYIYQLGAAPPVTITIAGNGNCTTTSTSATCSPSIKIPRIGPMLLSVSGIASSGNVSQATAPITGTAPAKPYADGDINGDGNPDILTVGASTAPGLWLSPGTGTGALGGAVDIGGAGNLLSPGTDGPGDWAGALILHGDFTSSSVQDVMAYYPSTGAAIVVSGTGDTSTLLPANAVQLGDTAFQDPVSSAFPTELVAAGNASQQNTGVPDLIGVASSGGSAYELDMFSGTTGGGVTGYGLNTQVLSAQTPDGAYNDWDSYDIATAQPGGNAVLFALNKTTGVLYESTNPTKSTSALIGTGNWQQITGTPWGTSPPALISGDINKAGQAEIWTRNGTTMTSYTITGTALNTEHANTFTQALHDWPMAEGNGTATVDTITTQNATFAGSTTDIGWAGDNNDPFAKDIAMDGNSTYDSPPASAIPTGSAPPSISIWFKTTTAGGVLVSIQKDALSSGQALPSQYDPVLYIGNDGKLYGEWWNGSASPAASTTIVDDGIWHHAVLTATSNNQTLYLDGQVQQTLTGATSFQFTPTNLAFGAGYIGGGWPNETNYQKTSLSDYRQYFNGEIADVTYG